MLPPRLLSASFTLFVFALASAGNAPAPQRSLPDGEWSVEFANGVVETCAIRIDGLITGRIAPSAGIIYRSDPYSIPWGSP